MKSKYLERVYDGYWKVVSVSCQDKKNCKYILKNLYNGREIEISGSAMRRLDEGKTKVSRILMAKYDLKKRWNPFERRKKECETT